MANKVKPPKSNPLKACTGIEGFDEITYGGLPRGRTTLMEGGPGSGKTIMSLQALANGARQYGEPGIFVAFEESSERIIANATKFGWDIVGLQKKKKLFFLNAQPTFELVQSGSFDLGGMLAALDAMVKGIKAKRIVFDAIDIVLTLLSDPAAVRREMYRLHEWLLERHLTAIITSKADNSLGQSAGGASLGFMQFMVDCAVNLKHEVVQGVSQRNLRVIKYRGSHFSENEAPFVIGTRGVEAACGNEMGKVDNPSTTERVSSGSPRLDAMLGGGYFRGASVLITGFPGTAKTTLCGAFAEEACRRGEQTLYVSFDSDEGELVRNLASVNIRVGRYLKSGLLRVVSARTINGSGEIHLMQIKDIASEHGSRCLVVDPLTALSKAENNPTAHKVAERLIEWAKLSGKTLLSTIVMDDMGSHMEHTPLQISTIADTWIHLNYVVHGGERNRGLAVIKSRGTWHSNQIRELTLSNEGITLADAYTAGGEVLMGTLRWEKESAERIAQRESEMAADRKQDRLASQAARLQVRLEELQLELKMKRDEIEALARLDEVRAQELASGKRELGGLRGAEGT